MRTLKTQYLFRKFLFLFKWKCLFLFQPNCDQRETEREWSKIPNCTMKTFCVTFIKLFTKQFEWINHWKYIWMMKQTQKNCNFSSYFLFCYRLNIINQFINEVRKQMNRCVRVWFVWMRNFFVCLCFVGIVFQ